MNKQQATLAVKKLIRWKDKSQLQELIDNGYLKPLPKHLLRCGYGECWVCDWKEFGVIGAIRVRFSK